MSNLTRHNAVVHPKIELPLPYIQLHVVGHERANYILFRSFVSGCSGCAMCVCEESEIVVTLYFSKLVRRITRIGIVQTKCRDQRAEVQAQVTVTLHVQFVFFRFLRNAFAQVSSEIDVT